MNCCSISFSLILLFSLASRADTTNAPAPAALPTPVPGIPVGWCIRAKTPVFADAKAAGFEYVELALQDVYGLSDPDFSRLVADLQRLGLNARSGYNPIPKELKIVGPDVDQAKLDAHLARVLDRAAALKLTYIVLNSGASWRVPEGFAEDRAFTQLADFSRHFAELAASRGITVLIEPLRATDSNQIITIAEANKLVETVNHANFQMMVDYSFLRIQQDDIKALLASGGHLRNIHISNPPKRTYPMTDAESDYESFFQVLKQINYRGGLSVHGSPGVFTNDSPRAITFLRTKAREVAGN